MPDSGESPNGGASPRAPTASGGAAPPAPPAGGGAAPPAQPAPTAGGGAAVEQMLEQLHLAKGVAPKKRPAAASAKGEAPKKPRKATTVD